MKRMTAFLVLAAALSVLFAANVTMADEDHQSLSEHKWTHRLIDIEGTKWVGTITYVDTKGATTEAVDVTVEFTTQDKQFFSGTLTDPNDNANNIEFSGVIGSLSAKTLNITATGYTILGNLEKSRHQKKLVLRGSDTANGRTFMGILRKQG